eukprot:scaffold9530_cov222-Alexandrium_tamarense.AAC.7
MNTAPSCYSSTSPFRPDFRFQEATPCALGLDDVSAWSRPRVLQLQQPSDFNSRLRCDPTYKLPRVLKSTALDEVLWDPGANICITSNLHILQNLTPTTPFPVGLAVSSDSSSVITFLCTMKGCLILPLTNGQFNPQVCYYNAMASDTIISPQAICDDSDGRLSRWSMSGNTDKAPGNLILSDDKDSFCVSFDLHERNGLWYCSAETLSNLDTLSYPTAVAAHLDSLVDVLSYWTSSVKVRPESSMLDEMWTPLILQTSSTPNTTASKTTSYRPLTQFYPHPFSKHETKMSAAIQRAAARMKPTLVAERGRRFHADYGFMRALSVNYSRPRKETERSRGLFGSSYAPAKRVNRNFIVHLMGPEQTIGARSAPCLRLHSPPTPLQMRYWCAQEFVIDVSIGVADPCPLVLYPHPSLATYRGSAVNFICTNRFLILVLCFLGAGGGVQGIQVGRGRSCVGKVVKCSVMVVCPCCLAAHSDSYTALAVSRCRTHSRLTVLLMRSMSSASCSASRSWWIWFRVVHIGSITWFKRIPNIHRMRRGVCSLVPSDAIACLHSIAGKPWSSLSIPIVSWACTARAIGGVCVGEANSLSPVKSLPIISRIA